MNLIIHYIQMKVSNYPTNLIGRLPTMYNIRDGLMMKNVSVNN